MTPPTDLFNEVQAAYEAKRDEWDKTAKAPELYRHAIDMAANAAFIAGAMWAMSREASKLERQIEDAEQTVQDRLHVTD